MTLLQRLPDDQIRGRSAIHSVVYVLQNEALVGGVANWTVEIRRNDPAGALTGAPDMSAAGSIASIPQSLTFAGGRIAYRLTTTPATPVSLPPSAGVPSGDLYVGLGLGPRLPAADLSLHMTMDTSFRRGAIGYTGAIGIVGLGWEAVNNTSPALLHPTQGLAFDFGTRFVDETLQPMADHASFLLPNFGYAGLFPDVAGRGDRFALRAIAQGSRYDVAVLLVGTPLLSPIPIPGIGNLCLLPNALPVDASLFQPFDPPGTVAAMFGPYPGLRGGADLYFQAVSYKFGGGNRLSTSCRIDF